MDKRIFEALITIAFKELYAYTDIDGEIIFCSWEDYCNKLSKELTKFKLTKNHFDLLIQYLKETYRGKV